LFPGEVFESRSKIGQDLLSRLDFAGRVIDLEAPGKFFGLIGEEEQPREACVDDFRTEREIQFSKFDKGLGGSFGFVRKQELVEEMNEFCLGIRCFVPSQSCRIY
jgi:hypothetical protein